jgi:hypothetical protein
MKTPGLEQPILRFNGDGDNVHQVDAVLSSQDTGNSRSHIYNWPLLEGLGIEFAFGKSRKYGNSVGHQSSCRKM